VQLNGSRKHIDWREHPLLKYDTVERWLNEKTGQKDDYKYHCLENLNRYCMFRDLTPDRLIAECTRASRLTPPANLKPKDMLMKWHASITNRGAEKRFYGATLLWMILPFFEANGYLIKLNIDVPKSPVRETSMRVTQDLTRRMVDAASTWEHQWAFICLAESGMRPNSVVELRYRHIMEGLERNLNPLPIIIPGRITKTGQSYIAFVLEDAVRFLKRILPANPAPDRRLVNFSTSRLVHHVSEVSVELGINPPTGLKPFTSGSWREYVQNRLEQVGVVRNRVSLLMGARPEGRDAHYSNPPPEELAAEYMKAADQLRVYPPLIVKV
jgi:integrase